MKQLEAEGIPFLDAMERFWKWCGKDPVFLSLIHIQLSNAKKVLLLCDGMGSGSVAGKESAGVTELAESLCEAGYSPSLLIRVINSALMIQAKEHPVTIDLTVIDCANGKMCIRDSPSCNSNQRKESRWSFISGE